MLENFQLSAALLDDDEMHLYRVPLTQALQHSLQESWSGQAAEYLDNTNEVGFDPGYTPEDNELFFLEDFELPAWLQGESSQAIHQLAPLSDDQGTLDSIKSIVGFGRLDDQEIILFQNFTRSRVIKPGRFLLMRNGTYESTPRPGLTLDAKLSAIYLQDQRKLLFRNFRTVNTFLPLAEVFEEASEEEIREILSHKLLAPEDIEALAVGANQWFSKRFAMLKASEVLDNFTARQIKTRGKDYGVQISISKGRVVFPARKGEAKRLLQFLNEEIFKGAITEKLYETNSKKKAD